LDLKLNKGEIIPCYENWFLGVLFVEFYLEFDVLLCV
jgi:hypothetical protein